MFIVTQLIGLAVIHAYTPQQVQVEINGTLQNVTYDPLPSWFQQPEVKESLDFWKILPSILIAFVVGFGITAFLDKQTIQTKGINRVAVILSLYTVGFLILLVGMFKIDVAYNYPNFSFFTRDSYIFLRDIMRGL